MIRSSGVCLVLCVLCISSWAHSGPQKIIIDTDLTDKPLYKSLIDAGVPRSQIIRAYAGKTEPEP